MIVMQDFWPCMPRLHRMLGATMAVTVSRHAPLDSQTVVTGMYMGKRTPSWPPHVHAAPQAPCPPPPHRPSPPQVAARGSTGNTQVGRMRAPLRWGASLCRVLLLPGCCHAHHSVDPPLQLHLPRLLPAVSPGRARGAVGTQLVEGQGASQYPRSPHCPPAPPKPATLPPTFTCTQSAA